MHSTYRARLLFALLMLGVSIYMLVPTSVYFSLTPEQTKEVRKEKAAFENYLPGWAPESHIVPGLDLQGGIHLVLGVDVNKALTDKTARIADRLQDMAESEKVPFKSIRSLDNEQYQIDAIFPTTSDASAFENKVLLNMGELVTVSSDENQFTLALSPQMIASLKKDAVDQTIHTIRTRIDKMGVTEPSISKQGANQIQIQLPGYDNPEEAKSLIGRTAQLEFQMLDEQANFLTKLTDLPKGVSLVNYGAENFLKFDSDQRKAVQAYLKGKVPADNVVKYGTLGTDQLRTYTLVKRVELTGDDLVDAQVAYGEQGQPAVSLTFSPSGGKIFGDLTKKSVGKRMAIVLEDRVDSAPVINTPILDGRAQITLGSGSREKQLRDANQLSLVLKSGALPAPVTFKEERSVGPSLGADSVRHAKNAFMVGGLLVALFMMLYYRVGGVISVLGVLFNVAFILATLSYLGATLTLPGIAGLLLTVGMAVDANVIINERIREELRLGKLPHSAVESGYAHATSAVMDANITTFIAGFVLWIFGTGPVQNFATTLLIGTVFSVITAIFVTRIFFDMLTINHPKTLSI